MALFVGMAIPPPVQAQTTRVFTFNDTISTSGSLDTIGTFVTGNYSTPRYYESLIQADSLSGGTNATLYVQHASTGSTDWITVETVTIDGVKTTAKKYGRFDAGKLRWYVLAPSSTQSTRVRVWLHLSERL